MAVDYKRYLAENVLNEHKTVTYRSLSRVFGIHSNLAKQILYEFHHAENIKRPRSVDATYIITGAQKLEEGASTSVANGIHKDQGDDDVMPSSPYISSSLPNQDADSQAVQRASVILVREEDLNDAKSTFTSISSIHIYSLQSTVLPDLNVLTDVSREMSTVHANEDPLEHGKQWGMVQNKYVKRRNGARPPPPPAIQKETAPAKQPVLKEFPAQEMKMESKKNDDADLKQPSKPGPSEPTSKPSGNTAPLKRQRSDILSSFSKAQAKQKERPARKAVSAAESAESSGAVEDVMFNDASEEEEPEELFPDTGKREAIISHETKKEREAKLRKMMEDDDEEMPDAVEPAEEPAEEALTIDQPPKKEELKEQVTVVGGRRRGRRQIMKKKTVKDEEGYLVTVEEPAWESFSEDEPAPLPKKKPAVSSAKAKPGGKPGQGNIMSFFSKK